MALKLVGWKNHKSIERKEDAEVTLLLIDEIAKQKGIDRNHTLIVEARKHYETIEDCFEIYEKYRKTYYENKDLTQEQRNLTSTICTRSASKIATYNTYIKLIYAKIQRM